LHLKKWVEVGQRMAAPSLASGLRIQSAIRGGMKWFTYMTDNVVYVLTLAKIIQRSTRLSKSAPATKRRTT